MINFSFGKNIFQHFHWQVHTWIITREINHIFVDIAVADSGSLNHLTWELIQRSVNTDQLKFSNISTNIQKQMNQKEDAFHVDQISCK